MVRGSKVIGKKRNERCVGLWSSQGKLLKGLWGLDVGRGTLILVHYT